MEGDARHRAPRTAGGAGAGRGLCRRDPRAGGERPGPPGRAGPVLRLQRFQRHRLRGPHRPGGAHGRHPAPARRSARRGRGGRRPTGGGALPGRRPPRPQLRFGRPGQRCHRGGVHRPRPGAGAVGPRAGRRLGGRGPGRRRLHGRRPERRRLRRQRSRPAPRPLHARHRHRGAARRLDRAGRERRRTALPPAPGRTVAPDGRPRSHLRCRGRGAARRPRRRQPVGCRRGRRKGRRRRRRATLQRLRLDRAPPAARWQPRSQLRHGRRGPAGVCRGGRGLLDRRGRRRSLCGRHQRRRPPPHPPVPAHRSPPSTWPSSPTARW